MRKGRRSGIGTPGAVETLLRFGLSLAIGLTGSLPATALAGQASAAPPQGVQEIEAQAVQLLMQRRLLEAIPWLMKLMDWQERHLSADSPRTLRTRRDLATVQLATSQPLAALRGFEDLQPRLERVYGATSPQAAVGLREMAQAARGAGLYEKAGRLAQEALSLQESRADTSPLELADTLEVIGTIEMEAGRYREGLPVLQRTLDLRTRHGAAPIPVATAEANVAGALQRLGDPAAALRHQFLALERYRRAAEDTRWNQAALWSNIGVNEQALGRLDEAIRALEQSRRLREEIDPADPDTAQILLNLAALQGQAGRHPQAQALALRARQLLEQRLGPKSVHTSWAYYRLADLARLRGDTAAALQWYGRTLALRRSRLQADHPDIATTLLGMAMTRLALGDSGAAERELEQALVIRRRVFGDDHPASLQVRFLLGLLHNGGDRRLRSYGELQAVGEGYVRYLQGEAPLLPLGERERVVGTVETVREAIYSLAAQGPEGTTAAFGLRLNQQGLLEGIERRQQELLARQPKGSEQLPRLRQLNQRLADLRLPPERRRELAVQKAELERQLYAGAPELQPRLVTTSQLATPLGENGVLVEYVRYRPVALRRGRLEQAAQRRYMALVSTGREVRSVLLGEEGAIDAAVLQALRRTREAKTAEAPDPAAANAWQEVKRLIVEPLLPLIGGRRRWFLSPDGELHRVAYAALGLESRRWRLLTSGRDLLEPAAQPSANPPLVIADPDFDMEPSNAGLAPKTETVSGVPLKWDRLPASRAEGILVKKLVGGRLLMDRGASVRTVMASPSPSVLHVASHGAFLITEASGGGGVSVLDPLAERLVDPNETLRRAVVVLAGANRGGSESGDDGYLSALEVSLLRLEGTRLVALSACETVRGEIRSGEGVYGLRRSLAIAGARTTLLSLWKVDDAATAELMSGFYGQLARGIDPHAALATVQAKFRNHPKVRLRHPYYWAGFQLYGP